MRLDPATNRKVLAACGVAERRRRTLTQWEATFTLDVIRYARRHGWRTAHFRKARTRTGWRTAVAGDGKGWPDLILLRRGRCIAAELKVGRNKPTPDQVAWLEAFRDCGVQAYVWTPEMWPAIERTLA